jgi:hypothetical protein
MCYTAISTLSCGSFSFSKKLKKKISCNTSSLLSPFSVLLIFYWEGTKSLNNYSFVLGTFIYVISFILFSFKFLKQEKFSWLLSNNYLLLISPILFFLGHSFMFAFDSQSLYYTKLFKNINLYPIVSYFVSIIYYSLINLYIYKENKSHV